MAFEWRMAYLNDAPLTIIDGDRGVQYPKQADFYGTGYCLFLNAGNVTANGLNFSTCAFISQAKDQALRRGKLQRGDVILTTRGTVGNVGYFGSSVEYDHMRINSGMLILRPDSSRLSGQFLQFFMRSKTFQDQIAMLTSGSAQPQLPIQDLVRVRMPVPSLKMQNAICSVLQVLDDRIALLHETNATLEAIVQALFKSWFVDFDPVGAKIAGRAVEGIDAATAALFPDGFEASEIGRIPVGWRVDSIYSISHVTYGAPFASKKFNNDGIGKPLIRIRDLKDELPCVFTDEVQPKGYMVQPGDIVVGMDGEFRAYLWGGEAAWLNQRVCVFHPRPSVSTAFLRQSITPLLSAVEASETATTVIHLGKNDIDRFRVLVPPQEVLEHFSKITDLIYKKIVLDKEMASSLTKLRDALLPRLISGQLSLPEAETHLQHIA